MLTTGIRLAMRRSCELAVSLVFSTYLYNIVWMPVYWLLPQEYRGSLTQRADRSKLCSAAVPHPIDGVTPTAPWAWLEALGV